VADVRTMSERAAGCANTAAALTTTQPWLEGHVMANGNFTPRRVARQSAWLVGRHFGRLRVEAFSHAEGKTKFWRCVCRCGRRKAAAVGGLLRGKVVSCGVCIKDPELFEDFLDRVCRSPSGCWEWVGARYPHGYGLLEMPGRGRVTAHRFSYEHFCGPIPAGLFVCHCCDNPPCIRPDHLFLGTLRDNTEDAVTKGRYPRGERNGAGAKLTPAGVVEIRQRRAAGESCESIARSFGVSRAAVRHVVSRTRWRHVQ
jgi:hypothetical protein